MEDKKHFGFRVDEELHYKLAYVAEKEARSMNGQILFAVRKYIEDFEAKYGEIKKPQAEEPVAPKKKRTR